ncbi:unnamed protein product [Microthlaspi erraticum]|uniref:F-box domain-containing protein n=1 Tax=Microthlaspi erraticum TaxID=1685480 RepID=A0A6D2IR69_9BRAS|nr:unnamed protein product [Microthlaspi erraticum]
MDRISNLSDDLLLKIVSSIPFKDVVATMLLSKRWRFLWTMLPKLDFNDDNDYGSDSELQRSKYEKFVKYVDRSLVLNRAPVLETLKFKVGLKIWQLGSELEWFDMFPSLKLSLPMFVCHL